MVGDLLCGVCVGLHLTSCHYAPEHCECAQIRHFTMDPSYCLFFTVNPIIISLKVISIKFYVCIEAFK